MNINRNYDKEYRDYYGPKDTTGLTPQQKKHRKQKASRNKVRKQFEKKELVHKHDNKDIDHKNGNPLNNNPGNLQVMFRSKNRSKH
jgi:hypothetical protein